ncbi:MAG: VOC family protein [Nitrospiraceae bacterium]|nr:VOC family protein [Nitrospiraceae bacterium]
MWKVDHFAFEVADLDTAIRFYTETLGMTLMFREVDEEHGEAFAFLELEGGNLELLQVLDGGAPPHEVARSFSPHLALTAGDLDALIATLETNGVPIGKGPLEIEGSVRWLYIADPDNNVIEFVQWLK